MIGFFILTSCNNKEKEFDENLRVAYTQLVKSLVTSTDVCEQVSTTWYNAIQNRRTPSGKYCNDFNEALDELFTSLRQNGVIDELKAQSIGLIETASLLVNPPDSRKECYDDFVELVSIAKQLNRKASDPSGTYRSYNDEVHELAQELTEEFDKFRIKYSQFTGYQ